MSNLFKIIYLVIIALALFQFHKTEAQWRRRNQNRKSCQYYKNGIVYRVQCNTNNAKYIGKQITKENQNSFCITTDGRKGICQSPAHCFSQYGNIEQYIKNKCKRGNGLLGICCTETIKREPYVPNVGFRIPIPYEPIANVKIDRKMMDEAIEECNGVIKKLNSTEKDLMDSGYFQSGSSMEADQQAASGPDDEIVRKMTMDGMYALEIIRRIAKRLNLTPIQARDALQKNSLSKTKLKNNCPKFPKCERNSKYRTIDGSCNNLRFPLWGKSLTQFVRLLPPTYSDGLNEFRMSVDGVPLPGARELSNHLASNGETTDKVLSVLFMQWSQFVAFDLSLAANTRAMNGRGLRCCNQTDGSPIDHPACRPIIIPSDDPFYSQFNRTCNHFVRNIAVPRNDCNLGHREQMNSITQIIDGSMVYGNTIEKSRSLRSFKNGQLKTSQINGRNFLPTNSSLHCSIPRSLNFSCVFAGDHRVNQQLGSTLLHLIFLREHNRIANQLQNLNPKWNDEIVFQETRRIIGAQIQLISYNEWLPLILGHRVMRKFRLLIQPSGYCSDYNPNLNPGVLNEFAAASFRWHTLVQGFYNLINSKGETKQLRMRDVFSNPSNLYKQGGIDESLNGITGQASQAFDPIFTEDIRNRLFEREDGTGSDLVATNIQRGRDHGLASYNDFRETCGLPRIRNFDELNQVFRNGSAQKFKQIYRNVDDIDLFIAGVHEKPQKEGILGPVFACITAEQFRRLKFGDRFWFENGNMAHSFSKGQLNEIRKVSLSGLICENGDNIRVMQPLALLQPTKWNPRSDCSNFPQINLNYWKN